MYYYNRNLIWRTVSPLVDEFIPLDHPRRKLWRSDGKTSSTQCDTVERQIKLLL